MDTKLPRNNFTRWGEKKTVTILGASKMCDENFHHIRRISITFEFAAMAMKASEEVT